MKKQSRKHAGNRPNVQDTHIYLHTHIYTHALAQGEGGRLLSDRVNPIIWPLSRRVN